MMYEMSMTVGWEVHVVIFQSQMEAQWEIQYLKDKMQYPAGVSLLFPLDIEVNLYSLTKST